ncbi:hypothetical protein OFC46_26170, partial [Escherichia coli]|nr:hypothetical protein [Escherichia coli]
TSPILLSTPSIMIIVANSVINRNPPISFLHRLIWIHLPNGILTVDRTLTNGRLTTSLTRLGRHLWYDQHPTILIFFFLLLSVGEYLYLPVAWPHFSF